MGHSEPGDVEARLREFFAADGHGVAAAYVFGSVVAGVDRPGSDVDVAVLYAAVPVAAIDAGPLDLEGALERHMGRPVDLVVLNTAPIDLSARVLRSGHLIADPDRSARIRFEVRARNEAFDLEPILREYRFPRARQS